MSSQVRALTDTHCHLDYESFESDRAEMIERAIVAGVERMLIPALDEQTCKAALSLAQDYPQLFVAIGVHPNYGETWDEGTIERLTQLASQPKVVAIGEIGLDYYWDKTPVKQQKEMLLAQLELAKQQNLPVVIHNREATQDVLEILLGWQAQLRAEGHPRAEMPGVMHSYSGNIVQAKAVLNAGFYLGFTGPVTFKKADDLRAVVASIPLDRILIETDSPFLTPEPFRGKRNEPAYVQYVAQKVAEVKQISQSELAHATMENAARLFEW